ncbi:MAG: SMC-Scp complex subunit ScpB [Chloroflexia bacterium]|nr:SMC-Scp complex subunit ScpB [Chloroflexia bacterium]MDQ3512451.1 SMC-Scp complex subunit ScpB [Chloroflexota bacterium]
MTGPDHPAPVDPEHPDRQFTVGAVATWASDTEPSSRAPDEPGAQAQVALPIIGGDGPPPGPELDALVEALLLISPGPATVDELAIGAGVPAEAIEDTLIGLTTLSDRGWTVQRHGDTVQLVTAPRFGEAIRRFLGLDREARLSPAALETLAIVAYGQPVTRAAIEAVRGVDSAGVLATLHGRGLVEAAGRLTTPGNPIQYVTTAAFLRHFGLASLDLMPPLGQMGEQDTTALLREVATDPAGPSGDATPGPTGERDSSPSEDRLARE